MHPMTPGSTTMNGWVAGTIRYALRTGKASTGSGDYGCQFTLFQLRICKYLVEFRQGTALECSSTKPCLRRRPLLLRWIAAGSLIGLRGKRAHHRLGRVDSDGADSAWGCNLETASS